MKETPKGSEKPLKIHYIFKFIDGRSTAFEIFLDPVTLNCALPETTAPEWARLSYQQCEGCRLDDAVHEICPVAHNISLMVDAFGNFTSHETAYVLVMTGQRDFSKSTTLRDGMTSLLGLYMAASGCPAMDKLKPLVRYHLPFASLHENVFRVVSMYLLVQHFLKKKGRDPDWEFKKLEAIYDRIRQVNAGIQRRLRHAAEKDASLTALANLDNTASLVPYVINETLDEIETSLNSYMEE